MARNVIAGQIGSGLAQKMADIALQNYLTRLEASGALGDYALRLAQMQTQMQTAASQGMGQAVQALLPYYTM